MREQCIMVTRVEKQATQEPHGPFRRFGIILTLLIGIALWPMVASASPWRFGVIADTQWTVADDGYGPHSVPAGIIQQIDQEFIRQGVKLVVAVGDTIDQSGQASIDTRALYAQDLYNAGIGFYPLRGNHDAGWTGSATEMPRVFPQTRSGVNNNTPADIPFSLGHDVHVDPAARLGSTFVVGCNFRSPHLSYHGFSKAGLTYSFDFENARFVLLDQWDDTGNTYRSTIADQQPWITARLSDPKRPQQAFVFGHKNLLGGNHKDNLFGNHAGGDPGDADPSQQPVQNAFVKSLADNHVHFYIGGHDHHHYDSVVTSPDGSAKVHQVIGQSASTKFYTPRNPVSTADVPISQDLHKIGYYIYTIDGPRVSVDYYGVPVEVNAREEIAANPELTGHWQKLLTFGYSLNGKEFLVAEGESYTTVKDCGPQMAGFVSTTVQILSGRNGGRAKTNYGKALTKAVDTGWTSREEAGGPLNSDVLTLWGMMDVGADRSDTYVLSMSFDPSGIAADLLSQGKIGLATKDAKGEWICAVDANAGGAKRFVSGPWDSRYKLGAYGIDLATNTAWAVLNHAGDFAVTAVHP